MNHYGYHRFTEDIDFWIAVSDANFDRLLAAIRDFFGEDLPGLDKRFLEQNEALFLGAVPNRIEVFKHCSGIEFSEAFHIERKRCWTAAGEVDLAFRLEEK